MNGMHFFRNTGRISLKKVSAKILTKHEKCAMIRIQMNKNADEEDNANRI